MRKGTRAVSLFWDSPHAHCQQLRLEDDEEDNILMEVSLMGTYDLFGTLCVHDVYMWSAP